MNTNLFNRMLRRAMPAGLCAGLALGALRAEDKPAEAPPKPEALKVSKPAPKKVPFLGLALGQVDEPLASQLNLPEGAGVLVLAVLPDSPAAKAGVLKHDVLQYFNDQLLVNEPQLQALVRHAGIGSDVTLKMLRKGREETVVVKLGEHEEFAAGSPSLAREYGIHRPGGFGYGMPPGDFKQFNSPLNGQAFADQMRELSERIKNLDGKPDQIRKEIERFQKELQEYSNDRRNNRDSKAGPSHDDLRRRPGDAAPSSGSARVWKDDRGGIRVEVTTNSDDGKGAPGAEPSVTATADGEGKVIVTQNSSTRMAWNDSDGSGELVIENGKKRATVKGPDGKEIFSGPVDTEEQLKTLPPKVRERLEGMEHTLKVTPRPAGKPAGEL